MKGGFAVLPTMGGQTALNCALALEQSGALARHNVELIGAKAEAIDKGRGPPEIREAMDRIGLESPRSRLVNSREQGLDALGHVGLPAIMRPSFTLGGLGGGIAYNREEFLEILERGLDASPVGEVLVEESVLGWKEYEMEVVRDRADNCIIVCSIENVDPMGVHTGDSITVAPALTLTDKEYQIMRNASIAVLREIGVETGGSNVQFAVNPKDGRLVVIEMNPRVSVLLLLPPRRPVSRSQRSRRGSRSATRSTSLITTSPAPRPPPSSRRSITSSPRSRVSPSRNSRARNRFSRPR